MSNLIQFGFPVLVYISCLTILCIFVHLEVKKTIRVVILKSLLRMLLITVVMMMFTKIGGGSLLALAACSLAIISIVYIDRDFPHLLENDQVTIPAIIAIFAMALLVLMVFFK